MKLVACGPWLQFSIWKRIALFLRFWLPWVIVAAWCSKSIWWRYWIGYRVFGTKPLVWADFMEHPDADEEDEIVPPSLIWKLYLARKSTWLWWEPEEQLGRSPLAYPVDREGKGHGWYPFW